MPAPWSRPRSWAGARRVRASSTPPPSTSTPSWPNARPPTRRARTSRACIRATSRSGARWPSRPAASTQAGIPYTVTPGVPSFAAAAALLRRELTVPGLAQSVVLTRTSGRASAMPERETLAAFAATGRDAGPAPLDPRHRHGGRRADAVLRRGLPGRGGVPRHLARRAGAHRHAWRRSPGQVAEAGLERTALILVGPALDPAEFRESALYSTDYDRRFRPTGEPCRARGGRSRS